MAAPGGPGRPPARISGPGPVAAPGGPGRAARRAARRREQPRPSAPGPAPAPGPGPAPGVAGGLTLFYISAIISGNAAATGQAL